MKELSESFKDNFNWNLYPEAESFLSSEIKYFIINNKESKAFSAKLNNISTEIFDWIDHMVIPKDRANNISKLGFVNKGDCFRVEDSVLFPIIVSKDNKMELAIKVENIKDFIKSNNIKSKIIGKEYSSFRKVIINCNKDFTFSAIERRGYNGFENNERDDIKEYKSALTDFKKRNRFFSSDIVGMKETKSLVQIHLKNLSSSRVADAFFRAERIYWQKRNKAGQTQFKRQNSLGVGWGNHDHHTYRSSRDNFKALVEIFELMGYKCRERFYAGEKAGWGAQILEHPDCDIVVFADVDITNSEKDIDFAHMGLNNMPKMGTVGLWIGLHGESILQAGMHHLEARFNFDSLRNDLAKLNVETMKPFSDFAFLRQAFTKGEIWSVDKSRASNLLKQNSITKEQYTSFIKEGAIGSHMENLQRRQGYKGFNQNSVTAIIKATNPLKQIEHHHISA